MVPRVGKQIFDAVKHRLVYEFIVFVEPWEDACFDIADMVTAGEAPCGTL